MRTPIKSIPLTTYSSNVASCSACPKDTDRHNKVITKSPISCFDQGSFVSGYTKRFKHFIQSKAIKPFFKLRSFSTVVVAQPSFRKSLKEGQILLTNAGSNTEKSRSKLRSRVITPIKDEIKSAKETLETTFTHLNQKIRSLSISSIESASSCEHQEDLQETQKSYLKSEILKSQKTVPTQQKQLIKLEKLQEILQKQFPDMALNNYSNIEVSTDFISASTLDGLTLDELSNYQKILKSRTDTLSFEIDKLTQILDQGYFALKDKKPEYCKANIRSTGIAEIATYAFSYLTLICEIPKTFIGKLSYLFTGKTDVVLDEEVIPGKKKSTIPLTSDINIIIDDNHVTGIHFKHHWGKRLLDLLTPTRAQNVEALSKNPFLSHILELNQFTSIEQRTLKPFTHMIVMKHFLEIKGSISENYRLFGIKIPVKTPEWILINTLITQFEKGIYID